MVFVSTNGTETFPVMIKTDSFFVSALLISLSETKVSNLTLSHRHFGVIMPLRFGKVPVGVPLNHAKFKEAINLFLFFSLFI